VESDRRTQQLYQYLESQGVIRLDEHGVPKPPYQRIGFRRREYDLSDLAAADFFYLVRPILEDGHQSLVDPGTLPPLAIWAHDDRTFSMYNQMFLARRYGVEVLEREAPIGLTLHPVMQLPLGWLREARIEENWLGEAEFKPMLPPDLGDQVPIESKLFKRIDSSITLPPMAGHVLVPSPESPKARVKGTYQPRSNLLFPIEPAYRRSDLEKIGPFDIARFHERLLGEEAPGLVISKRLYQLLRQYHFLADVVPVRIIEE
jgi:hypothetical protein